MTHPQPDLLATHVEPVVWLWTGYGALAIVALLVLCLVRGGHPRSRRP